MNEHLSQPRTGSRPNRKIRVVLVDDSELARTALVRLLQELVALQVTGVAENALEGLSLAARLEPDLVITDLQMPGANGLQLVELLRREYPAIRSIIISAQDGPALRASSLQHGADAFINKQRLADELPALIARLFFDAPQPATSKCIQ